MQASETQSARSTVVAFLALLIFFPMANAVSAADAVAPAAIVLLPTSAPSTAPQLHTTLSWTAPGDDGTIGTAASYDIRFRTDVPLTEANWGTATQVTYGMSPIPAPIHLVSTEPAPQPAGTLQSFTVVGLKPNTTYYWAIKAADEVGNTGAISNSVSGTTAKYTGYGYQAIGGGEQPICVVTKAGCALSDTSCDSGVGTLRSCVAANRYIVFSAGGAIPLQSKLSAQVSNITIDGSTAPFPGITITTTSDEAHAYEGKCLNDGMPFGSSSGAKSHQIATYLRFQGNMTWGTTCPKPACIGSSLCTSCNGCEDLFGLVGSGTVQHVVMDHLTIRDVGDSAADFAVASTQDVTFSYNLLIHNRHPMLMSQAGARISIHHNALLENHEREPAIDAVQSNFDFVNNVLWGYSYDPLGSARAYPKPTSSFWHEPSAISSSVNIVNNVLKEFDCTGITGCVNSSTKALIYGNSPGYDSGEGGSSYSGCKKQGTVYTGSGLGPMWVAGNTFPSANCDEYSTVTQGVPVPAAAQVTTSIVGNLWSTVLSVAGTLFPTADEQTIINTAQTSLNPGNTGGTPPANVNNLHRTDTTVP